MCTCVLPDMYTQILRAQARGIWVYISDRTLVPMLQLCNTKILTKNKKSCSQELEKGLDERVKSKWAAKACIYSATADQNKILIVTSQAAKHYVIDLLMCYGLTCDY